MFPLDMMYTHDMDLGSAMLGGCGTGYGYGGYGCGYPAMFNPYALNGFANSYGSSPIMNSQPNADMFVSHHKKDNTAEVILTGAAIAGVGALLIGALLKKPSQAAEGIRTIFKKASSEVHIPTHTPSAPSAPSVPRTPIASSKPSAAPVIPARTPAAAPASTPVVRPAATPAVVAPAPVVKPATTPAPVPTAAPTTPVKPTVSTAPIAKPPVAPAPATPVPAAPTAPVAPAKPAPITLVAPVKPAATTPAPAAKPVTPTPAASPASASAAEPAGNAPVMARINIGGKDAAKATPVPQATPTSKPIEHVQGSEAANAKKIENLLAETELLDNSIIINPDNVCKYAGKLEGAVVPASIPTRINASQMPEKLVAPDGVTIGGKLIDRFNSERITYLLNRKSPLQDVQIEYDFRTGNLLNFYIENYKIGGNFNRDRIKVGGGLFDYKDGILTKTRDY